MWHEYKNLKQENNGRRGPTSTKHHHFYGKWQNISQILAPHPPPMTIFGSWRFLKSSWCLIRLFFPILQRTPSPLLMFWSCELIVKIALSLIKIISLLSRIIAISRLSLFGKVYKSCGNITMKIEKPLGSIDLIAQFEVPCVYMMPRGQFNKHLISPHNECTQNKTNATSNF